MDDFWTPINHLWLYINHLWKSINHPYLLAISTSIYGIHNSVMVMDINKSFKDMDPQKICASQIHDLWISTNRPNRGYSLRFFIFLYTCIIGFMDKLSFDMNGYPQTYIDIWIPMP